MFQKTLIQGHLSKIKVIYLVVMDFTVKVLILKILDNNIGNDNLRSFRKEVGRKHIAIGHMSA